MLPPLSAFQAVRQRYIEREQVRRELVALAQQVQTTAKRAIFSVHRDDLEAAQAFLSTVRERAREAERLCHHDPALSHEGSWRAAQEEWLEAELLVAALGDHEIDLPLDEPERVIGALSDVLGELARVLIHDVTQGRLDRVTFIHQTAQQSLEFLLEFDATGYGRQKVDQARQHLRKIEDVAYDLALRRTV